MSRFETPAEDGPRFKLLTEATMTPRQRILPGCAFLAVPCLFHDEDLGTVNDTGCAWRYL